MPLRSSPRFYCNHRQTHKESLITTVQIPVGHQKVALRDQKSNLVILEGGKQVGGINDDIGKNLFKICCAILNLRPGQRGLPSLDDNLLMQYLDQVNINRFLHDDNWLAQFQVLKNLINRKAFSLNDRQIRMIH